MIVCAALQIKGEINPYIICGLRHSDCFETLYRLNPELSRQARANGAIVQGFINTNGDFLDRYEAYIHACSCGQIPEQLRQDKEEKRETELYSEDLY